MTSSGGATNPKDLVDLEQIVLNWAKQIFEITKTKAEAKIHKKHLQFNINWSHLLNECLEPRYTVSGMDARQVRQAKEEQCLFKSTFANTTDREQEYSFKAERSTRSSATVIVEKGLCRGVEMALKLKTPCEVVEANAGFHTEMSVTHVGENTAEEELIWGIDSTVRVPPHAEAIAELVILEDRQTRAFTLESRLSGRVIVTVTNLKDNNSLVTVIEGRIADIIRGLANHPTMGFVCEDELVTFTSKGVCKFKYGVEQKVRVTERRQH